jgi:hypothetical protein
MVRSYKHDIAPESDDAREERTIRDLRPSAARQRLQVPRPDLRPEYPMQPPHRRSRLGIWVAAIIALIVLIGAAALLLFPSTTITVVPRTHVVPFDASNPLTAYPAATAATGTIPYTVLSQVFEDSAIVQASGTEEAEEKASGTVTVYNETDRTVRLIKNTRFQSPDGLIFRIPASVDVPPAKAGTPGTLSATVFADETGPKYNIAATDRFTLPGLKTSPDFTKVYAKSTAAFTGGFSGQRPAVSPAILESSKAEVRGRLEEKAHELWRTVPAESLAFPGLMLVTYETLPATQEPGGGVRITERATVSMPVFAATTFASSVAQAVSADAETASISIRFSDEIGAQPVGTLDAASLGRESITFSISGRGQLVWQLDVPALQEALAGREEAAFEPIVKGFAAIEEARARLTPFWKRSFPQDPASIKVTVGEPPQF